MKNKTGLKIISGLILLLFVVFVFRISPSVQAASEASISSLYSNPNQYSNNTYKFKIKDIVNSNLLTNIIGCTGVTNKAAEWMSRFVQSPLKMGKFAKQEIAKKRKQLEDACGVVASATIATGDSVPLIGGGLGRSINKGLEKMPTCRDRIKTLSDEEVGILIDEEKATTARDFKEQCFDGIAITLAKNQLTAMTRSAMNWVNSGYGGNPFFVQNMRNLTTGIERNVIETGTDILLDKALGGGNQNPYARNFAQSTIYNQGIRSSSSRFLGGLQSSLEYFITDPRSYYSDKSLDEAEDTRTALMRAQDANNAFAKDFSLGGWNGWLALTQREQNNPLGFNMIASQYLADTQAQKITETQNELTQNNGFLSQKTCVEFMSEKDIRADLEIYNSSLPEGTDKETYEDYVKQTYPNGTPCLKEKIITPGSIIKEKTANYLNSPERQLELAKTINDSLNALFSVLISKLQIGGLSGLSDAKVATNWTDNLNTINASDNGNTPYDNNGAYDGFNITRDLGNTYIHEDTIQLGTWNAKACPPGQEDKTNCNLATTTNPNFPPKDEDNKNIKLYPNIAPEVYKKNKDGEIKLMDGDYGSAANPVNGYYTVKVAGNTKLISEGYNEWEVGDRAFWDGKEWQNWKKGQASPIRKRGVIQIQQDYIVAAKEMLKVLPGVMPALGELDYCLPGPNPNYKINSSDHQTTFNNWIGSIFVGPVDTSGERFGVKIDNEGSSTYDALRNAYQNNNIWSNIISQKLGDIKYDGQTADLSVPNILKIFSNICNNDVSDSLSIDIGSLSNDCKGNYTYAKNGNLGTRQANNLEFKNKIQEYISNYTGSYLFDKFYEIFDQKMNDQYFKKMTNRYIEHENKPVAELNTAYIPMAESGFEFTKNIVSYADDTINAQNDYASTISSAKINIAKLDPIKNEVSLIIKEAQDRRDANLTKILNEEAQRSGEKVLTPAAYRAKYKGCLDEENIQVFDIEDIVGSNEKRGEEACSDGVDNDLDGLIDSKDSDCGATSTIRPSTRRPNTTSDNYGSQDNY